jgi:hypothetical protein
MASIVASGTVSQAGMVSNGYQRFAGVCGLLMGGLTLLYSVSFIALANEGLSSLCLLANGLLSTAVLVGLYERLRTSDASFALWALVLGLAGSIGSALHGGYDLAAVLRAHGPVDPNLPGAMDPRGLLTFGATGLALWVFAWLMLRSGQLPKALGYLGYLLAALQIVLYLGRLTVVDATNPIIVVPALVAGFVAAPIFFLWVGVSLWRGARA